jgi:hypothetical protein
LSVKIRRRRRQRRGEVLTEVGRLVENEQLGVGPHGGGEDDLDLLSSRQSLELVVLGDVSVESDVHEVLANELGRHLSGSGSLARRLEVVELLDELGEAELEELLSGEEDVVLQRRTSQYGADEERRRGDSPCGPC